MKGGRNSCIMAVNRKSSNQIKDDILSSLNKGPLSVEQIRKKIDSNWSTANNYLEELSKDGKVKEIISADKSRMYQRIYGDTYFDIPITEEERKKFRTLFNMIMKKYADKGQVPNKTQLSKTAVKVITSPESGLDLPIVSYLYGMIPLMVADPSQTYNEEESFKNRNKINEIIEIYMKENSGKKSRQLDHLQHLEINDKLYILRDEIIRFNSYNIWDKDKLFELLNDFFVHCPLDEDFKEIFYLTNKFISTVRKLSYLGKLENNKTEILLAFDVLWKFIATYKFYVSIKKRIPDAALLNLYLGNALQERKDCAQESMSNLYSIYWSRIDRREIDVSPEVHKLTEAMQDWTGED